MEGVQWQRRLRLRAKQHPGGHQGGGRERPRRAHLQPHHTGEGAEPRPDCPLPIGCCRYRRSSPTVLFCVSMPKLMMPKKEFELFKVGGHVTGVLLWC